MGKGIIASLVLLATLVIGLPTTYWLHPLTPVGVTIVFVLSSALATCIVGGGSAILMRRRKDGTE